MYNVGKRLQIMLAVTAMSAGIATSTLTGIKNDKIIDSGSFQRQQVTAIAEKSKGTEALEEILGSHGYDIRYDAAGNITKASVNVGEALAAECGTDRFSGTKICTEYVSIPASFEAQALTNRKYSWVWPSTVASISVMMAAAFGVIYLGFTSSYLSSRRIPRGR